MIQADFYDWVFGEYMDAFRKETQKLPFHVNLLEFLHANENTNSRVLAGLLRKPEILQSLFDFIGGNFAELKVNKPKVTNEEGRIDILVKDIDYWIIIENKINGAADQPKQLARYIDNVKLFRKEENIYVIYCTRDFKVPSDQSWGDNGYKDKFKHRFYNLSFRCHVLPWLQNVVLPEVKNKDIFLKSYIEQYIDYLQGLFNQRGFEKNMNARMIELIESKIGSTDKETVQEYIDAVNKLGTYLMDILQKIEQKEDMEFIQEGCEKLRLDLKGKILESAIKLNPINEGYPQVEVSVNCSNGINVRLCLEANVYYHTVYYGFLREKENENNDAVQEFLNQIQSEEKFDNLKKNTVSTNWWYLQHKSNKDCAYSEFVELIENIMQY